MKNEAAAEQIQKRLEKKAKQRLKKKKPHMAVSGKSVLDLSRLIRRKAKRSAGN